MNYAMERAAAMRAVITSETTEMEKVIALRDELAQLHRLGSRLSPGQRERAREIVARLRCRV